MLSDFLFSLNAIAPMMLIIILGNILVKLGVLKPEFIKQGGKLCFNFFLPIQFFVNLYKNENNFSELGAVSLYVYSCIIIVYVMVLLISFKMEDTPQKVAGLVCGFYKSNYALIGMSLAASLLSPDNVSGVSLIIGILIAFNNVVSVLMFTLVLGDKGEGSFLSKFWNIVKEVFTNPLLIGTLLGFIASKLNITWPSFIDKPLNQLANVATPLSLLILGADFSVGSFADYKKEMLFVVWFKGIVVPAAVLGIAAKLGFDGKGMVAVLVAFSSPAGSSTYIMAEAYGADSTLTTDFIMVSTIVSAFTIFCGVLFLRTMGYL